MAINVGTLIAILMMATLVVVPVTLPATAAAVDCKKPPPPPRARYISYWALITCDEREVGLQPCMPYVAGKVGPAVPARCCHAAKSFFHRAATLFERYERCVCWLKFASTRPNLGEALVSRIPAACGFKVPKDITSPANCPLKH